MGGLPNQLSISLEILKSLQTISNRSITYEVQEDAIDQNSLTRVSISCRKSLLAPLRSYNSSVNFAKNTQLKGMPVNSFLRSIFENEAHPLDINNTYVLSRLKEKLDHYFQQDKSLKAVYVDLSYHVKSISKEDIKKHFQFFLQLLKEQKQYRGYFHKLEYSVTKGFVIFFIGIFENSKNQPLNQYYLFINKTWQRSFEKLKALSFISSSLFKSNVKISFLNSIYDNSFLIKNMGMILVKIMDSSSL